MKQQTCMDCIFVKDMSNIAIDDLINQKNSSIPIPKSILEKERIRCELYRKLQEYQDEKVFNETVLDSLLTQKYYKKLHEKLIEQKKNAIKYYEQKIEEIKHEINKNRIHI